MSLVASFQYWFFTIFMQFMPLSEVEPGSTFTYSVSPDFPPVIITVQDVVFEDEQNMRWILDIKYDSDSFTETHTAILAHTPKDKLHIISYKEDGREMLDRGQKVHLPKRGAGIIVSTDETYILKQKQSYETEIDTEDGAVKCNKQGFASEDGVKAEVFHDNLFGLIRVSLKIPETEGYIEFTRQK